MIDAGALQKVTTKTDYIYGNAAAGEMPDVPYKVKIDGAERVSYRFDPLLRQAVRTLKIADGVTETTSYTYKKSNRGNGDDTMYVESVTRSGNGAAQTLWYSYDPHGNITEVKEGTDKATAVLNKRYTYDSLDELIRVDDAEEGKTYTYTYDEGGNLTEEKIYSYQTADTVTGTALESHSYAYTDQWKDLLTSYDGTAIIYDGIGNPLSYMGKSLTWQRGRELASVTTTEGTWQYGYDDNGYRTEKTAPDGSTTKYYRNGTTLLAQVTTSDRLDFFYDEKGQPLGFKYSVSGTGAQPVTSLYYYRTNLQGDIEGILDASGNEVCSYTYDAWGRLHGVTGSAAATIGVKNPLRYHGYFYDEETGFYYVSNRYYDSEIHRFINADGYIAGVGGDIRGYNLFSYCFNNPINMGDSTGNWPSLSQMFTALAVAAVVVAVVATCGVVAPALAAAGGGILSAGAVAAGALITAGAAATAAIVTNVVENTSYHGPTRGQSVYVMRDKTTYDVQYVGRTNNPIRRQNEHAKDPKKADLLPLEVKFSWLTKSEARAMEQLLISSYALENLINARREIATGNVAGFTGKMRNIISIFDGTVEDELLNLMGR